MVGREPRADTGRAELCKPGDPCILDAFLVADPPLKQVVSHTFEAGLRGRLITGAIPGQFLWKVGVYRTDAFDDILLLARRSTVSAIFPMSARRSAKGVEAGLSYHWKKWTGFAPITAILKPRSSKVSSCPRTVRPWMPMADIFVHSGDHLPLMPAHRVVLDAEYR